ncbi:MAG TPA: hypothetical protein VMZ71_16390 [Gemmataceae bacterium]|nr:hypothetical protein [Gemmataceae bacterium]
MRKFLFGLAALVGIAATSSTASAQNRTFINNSGNGANNTLVVRNGGVPLYAPPSFGGVNRTVIRDSGNGIGNTIGVSNGGGFGHHHTSGYGGFGSGYGGYPFGPGGYGVNVNVITNSGNGVGNTIQTTNGTSGGLNINVITNSGNGIGNTIGVRNR